MLLLLEACQGKKEFCLLLTCSSSIIYHYFKLTNPLFSSTENLYQSVLVYVGLYVLATGEANSAFQKCLSRCMYNIPFSQCTCSRICTVTKALVLNHHCPVRHCGQAVVCAMCVCNTAHMYTGTSACARTLDVCISSIYSLRYTCNKASFFTVQENKIFELNYHT